MRVVAENYEQTHTTTVTLAANARRGLIIIIIKINAKCAGTRPSLTFGVGSIKNPQYSYHCVHPIHAKIFQSNIIMLLHFSQIIIVLRVCTLLVVFILSLLKLFKFHICMAQLG